MEVEAVDCNLRAEFKWKICFSQGMEKIQQQSFLVYLI
jgi:hypothetical protein